MAHFFDTEIEELRRAGVQNPEGDFNLFCQSQNFSNFDSMDTLTQDQHFLCIDFFKRRKNREPLERIINQADFRGLTYAIAPHIFKPGFETETTIDHALEQIKDIENPRILDCGTGSGCILISLLKERADATGMGIDIDEKILKIANDNALRHGVSDRTTFEISDWGHNLNQEFDLIISNPPRIPRKKIHSLVKEVAIYDPHIALDGGETGADFYLKSAALLQEIGSPHSVCVLQVGQIVIDAAAELIQSYGYHTIHIGRNYKYTPNCIIFHKSSFIERKSWTKKFIDFFRRHEK